MNLPGKRVRRTRLVRTDRFIVANDEDQVLRVFRRGPGQEPLQGFDMTAFLFPNQSKPETDIEGATSIGNRIYWSRRRITLKKGEKLLTDGRITARTRCANRVEEAPQQQASPNEPPVEKFEEPVRSGEGTAMKAPPVAFRSALMNRPQVPGLGPAGPLSMYDPFGQGGFVPISAPPLPSGVCGPIKKKKGDEFGIEGGTKQKKRPSNPCGEGGSLGTPEPGTWLLFISGLALIYWQSRRKFSRA